MKQVCVYTVCVRSMKHGEVELGIWGVYVTRTCLHCAAAKERLGAAKGRRVPENTLPHHAHCCVRACVSVYAGVRKYRVVFGLFGA